MTWSSRNILLLAGAAALFNLIPRLLAEPGADVVFHYTLIDCFARQLWQGDLYPRWCMEANTGFGSPVFFFYFPLAYYVTSLLYPLHFMGVDIQGIYVLSIGLANFTAFLTCYYWLKEFVSPGRAVLCALLFLFLPYRMELMLYRSAFSELWGVSLLPLLFLYTRRLAAGKKGSGPRLAFAASLCLLTHVPATIAGLMASSVQIVLMTRRLLPKLQFAVAVALAGAATAFYTIPAKFFLRYLSPRSLQEIPAVWANSFIRWIDFTDRTPEHGHLPILINLGITLLFTGALGGIAWARRAQIRDPMLRREVSAWATTGALATFMLFPLSEPLWRVLGAVSIVAFPWRMQSLVMFALIYFAAVHMQWLMSPKRLKTWKADYAACLFLFLLLGFSILNMRPPQLATLFDRVVASHVVHVTDYRTRWTDPGMDAPERILALSENPSPPAKAAVISGHGKVDVLGWNYRAIDVAADMAAGGAIRLQHFYFPLWRLTMDGKDSDGLTAEPHSGLMRLRVPAGKHVLHIASDMSHAMGRLYALTMALSLAAWLLLLVMLRRR